MNCIHSGGVNTHWLLEEQSLWPGTCNVNFLLPAHLQASFPSILQVGSVLAIFMWSLFTADVLNHDKASQPC